MNIPISLAVPWIILITIAAIAGAVVNAISCYPENPTLRGWVWWSLIWCIPLTVIYATNRGWITWT